MTRVTIVWLELDGDRTVSHRFVTPDGIAQLTLVEDLPDPYRD